MALWKTDEDRRNKKVFEIIQKVIIRGFKCVDRLIKYDELPWFQEWSITYCVQKCQVVILDRVLNLMSVNYIPPMIVDLTTHENKVKSWTRLYPSCLLVKRADIIYSYRVSTQTTLYLVLLGVNHINLTLAERLLMALGDCHIFLRRQSRSNMLEYAEETNGDRVSSQPRACLVTN